MSTAKACAALLAIGFGLALTGCVAAPHDFRLNAVFVPLIDVEEQAPKPLLREAIELRQESDEAGLKAAGGVFLGEMEVDVTWTDEGQAVPAAPTLHSGVSRKVAASGGTHFYLEKLDAKNVTFCGRHDTEPGDCRRTAARWGKWTHASYAVFRVEAAAWPELDPRVQPVRR